MTDNFHAFKSGMYNIQMFSENELCILCPIFILFGYITIQNNSKFVSCYRYKGKKEVQISLLSSLQIKNCLEWRRY